MYKKIAFPFFEELIFKAASGGAVLIDSAYYSWKISGDCLDPYTTTYFTDRDTDWRYSESARAKAYVTGSDHVYVEANRTNVSDVSGTVGYVDKPRFKLKNTITRLDILTRCRACEKCALQRKYLWYHRAKNECLTSFRTWFGTLTYSPSEIMIRGYRRDITLKKFRETDSLASPPITKRAENDRDYTIAFVKECVPDVTKFLKRLRKNCGGKISYMIVPELHKSGNPHFHFLIHEKDVGEYLTYRILTKAWTHGFSQFNLVSSETPAASYVAKYLSKEMYGRVRASQKYGQLY